MDRKQGEPSKYHHASGFGLMVDYNRYAVHHHSVVVVSHALYNRNIQESVSLHQLYGNTQLMERHSIPKQGVVISTNVHHHVIILSQLFVSCNVSHAHEGRAWE